MEFYDGREAQEAEKQAAASLALNGFLCVYAE
jgi:hypothetical protein